ncbi:alpha-amylase family protein [Paenarthrobacter ureafaciens]|uniref:alpha-amylase family protein n=1 Tax=Paenarthrobacter ureafaciens TaxID=37931 RepID=UPI002DB7797E|nr:alpha-amylase family protein [Paenarthrobacter ureafaciens]MEC3853150.1 alpha-amylase family protein [Paenarthrobacter ureafaciens]
MTTIDVEKDRATEALWWRRPFRMLQTNLRETDAGMDVEQVLDDIQRHGADAWLLNGGGILSFYPTDLEFQTRNPHLADRPSGDFVGDALSAAHARGMRVLARMDFSKVSADIGRRHPDWLFVSADGRNQLYNGLLSVCPSARYYQEKAFEVLDEFASRYRVDGFFFNWMSFNEIDYDYHYWGPCHCEACTTGFAKFSSGASLPTSVDDPAYVVWREFAAAQLNDLTARFRSHIRTLLPEAGLVLGDKADIMFHEANSKVGRDFWAFATGQAVSLSKSQRPDVPVLVNSAVFLDMPYRYAPITDEHYAMYFAQAISRGAIPSTYTMGTPKAAPFPNLAAAGAMTRFHRDHQDVYDGLVQNAPTLLVRRGGSKTASWWEDDGDLEFRGCYESLQRAHIPFDMVSAQDIADALAAPGSERYRVVLLADVGPVDERAVVALDEWVNSGGHLVSIGSSGFSDADIQLTTSPASSQVAIYNTPAQLKNMYVAQATPGLGDGFDRISPIYGEYRFLNYRSGATKEGTVLAQVPFGPPEQCYGTNTTEYPGAATLRSGSGSHTLFPWLVGTTARDLGSPLTPSLITATVERLGGRGGWRTAELPGAVEIVVGRNGHDTVLHLLNFSGLQRNTIGSPITIRGAKVTVSTHVQHAVSLTSGKPLTVEFDGTRSTIELPPLGLFDVIVMRNE